MPFFPVSKDDMVSNGLRVLRDYSNITQLSPGGKARLLLDSTTDEQYAQHRLFDENLAQAFIRWAEDRFLDYFGDMLNIPRIQATTAETTIEDKNFMFYVDGGTFGDLNNQLDMVIPAGEEISTPDFPTERPTYATDDYRPRQNKIVYDLVDSLTLPSGSSFAFGKIRARVEGIASDVPRSVLTQHSFTNYVLSSTQRLRCTNKYAISSGSDRETDRAYRYRLMNAFKARERGNKLAVRLAALSIPGVADVTEVNYEQGPGTFSMYVQALTPTTSPVLIEKVQTVVEEVNAFGTRPFVLSPLPLGVELVLAVNWKSSSSQTDQSSGYAAIRNAVENYMNLLAIGESLDLEELASIVTKAHPAIQGIGIEKSGAFEEVYVYRMSADQTNARKTLFTNQVIEPLYNERIILETDTKSRGIIFL